MKEKIKILITSFGILFSVKPIRLFCNWFSLLFNLFYSGYIQGQLKSVGANLGVQYPLYLVNGRCIIVGANFRAGRRLRMETFSVFNGQQFSPCLSIGNNVAIHDDCHIGCVDYIRIGNNVLMASKIYITDHFHGGTNTNDLIKPPVFRELFSKGQVVIEDNVWIGEGVVILPNVTIGKNCIIGANSVVTKSFSANNVIAGNPARIIKNLSES